MSTPSQATAHLEAHFTHPWSEDDKGKLDDQGYVLQKCTLVFLDGLVKTMLGRDGELDDNPSGPDADRTKDLINSVFREIHRLQLHPDLYPEDDAEDVFVETITQIAINKGDGFQLSRLITDPEVWESLGTDLGVVGLYELQNQRQPVTPWEKFLFSGSPGSGLVVSPTTRVIPPGGTKLLARWHKKSSRIARGLRALSAIKPAEPGDPGQSQVDAASQSIGIHNSHFSFQVVTLEPNPIYQGGWRIPGYNEQLGIPHLSEYINGKLSVTRMYQPSMYSTKCVYITPR